MSPSGRAVEPSLASAALAQTLGFSVALGAFLAERIWAPLGMSDAGFSVPEKHHGRIAEPFAKDPENATDVALLDVKGTSPITGLRFQENLDCARYPEGDRPAIHGVFTDSICTAGTALKIKPRPFRRLGLR